MAHVKYNGVIILTVTETGEAIFIPCDGTEISQAQWEALNANPSAVTYTVSFSKDDKTDTLRANIS